MLKWAALENSHSSLGTVLASREREHRDRAEDGWSFSHFKNKMEASLVYVASSRPVRLHSETCSRVSEGVEVPTCYPITQEGGTRRLMEGQG